MEILAHLQNSKLLWPTSRRLKMIFAVLLSVIALIGLQVEARAQSQTVDLEKVEGQLTSYQRNLSFIERYISPESDDDMLIGARSKLHQLGPGLDKVFAPVEARQKVLEDRLSQLGSAPTDGTVEDIKVTEERTNLAGERQSLLLLTGRRDELVTRTDFLLDALGTLRSELFQKQLTKRTPINSELFTNLASDTSQVVKKLKNLVTGWYTFSLDKRLDLLALALLFALAISFGCRWFFARIAPPQYPSDIDLTRLQKISFALTRTIFPSLLLAISLAVFLVALYFFGALPDNIYVIFQAGFIAIFGVYFVFHLAKNVLSPRQPNLRVIAIGDLGAKRLFALVVAMALVHAVDFMAHSIGNAVASPLGFTIANSFIAAMLIGLLLLAILSVPKEHEINSNNLIDAEKQTGLPGWVRIIAVLVGIAILGAALSGYIGLSRFIAQQVVVTSTILATMALGYVASRDLTLSNAFKQTGIGTLLAGRFKLLDERLDQIGLGVSILLMLAVFFIGIPSIMMQWGTRLADILSWAQQLFFGIKIGDFRFSLSAILYGFIVFLVVIILVRLFQNWLTNTVLSRTKIDSGVRHSIRTGIGYCGIALALMLGLTSAGINLSSLALVAGALSLGIGFGLQNIVSNFVSGLILLVERPIKVGDFVEAGAVRGTVKKISVRATELETPNNLSIILPNSELINSTVGNWTHKRKNGRLDLAVGFAYGTSAKKVREILLKIADEHPEILKFPEPFVFFQGFGASSIDVQLRVHLRDYTTFPKVQTDLYFAVMDAFEEHNIEIPFPQSDLHIRSIDPEAAKALKK